MAKVMLFLPFSEKDFCCLCDMYMIFKKRHIFDAK